MTSFTIQDIHDIYNNDFYHDVPAHLDKNWAGNALDILRDQRISLHDRIWIVTRISKALSQREKSLFMARIVLPLAKKYADKAGSSVIDTVTQLHEKIIAGNNSTPEEWEAVHAAAWDVAGVRPNICTPLSLWEFSDPAKTSARTAARVAGWTTVWNSAFDTVCAVAIAAAQAATLAASNAIVDTKSNAILWNSVRDVTSSIAMSIAWTEIVSDLIVLLETETSHNTTT